MAGGVATGACTVRFVLVCPREVQPGTLRLPSRSQQVNSESIVSSVAGTFVSRVLSVIVKRDTFVNIVVVTDYNESTYTRAFSSAHSSAFDDGRRRGRALR